MKITGYYYLLKDGSLKYSPTCPPEADNLVKYWAVDQNDRKYAWVVCIQALAFGANMNRVLELAQLWGLTNEDAPEYAKRNSIKLTVGDTGEYVAEYSNPKMKVVGKGATALAALVDNFKQQMKQIKK